MIHAKVHPTLNVEGCFACRISSVSVAAAAMPTRRVKANEINDRENRWSRDLPAYRELRRQGLQPKAIDGCADVAVQAESKYEVESGQVLQREDRKIVEEVMSGV